MNTNFHYLIRLIKTESKLRFINKTLRFWLYLITQRKALFNVFYSRQRKSIIPILREVLLLWRYWKLFPFHYFRYKLYLDKGRGIEDLYLYVPEFYFDNIIIPHYNSWLMRLFLSDKVQMSKFLNAYKIPSANMILYAENGNLFSLNNIIINSSNFDSIIKKVNSKKIFLKPAQGSGGNGIIVFTNVSGIYYNKKERLDFNLLHKKSLEFDFLLESGIQQYDVLQSYNSSSINTLRIITLLIDGEVRPLKGVLRMGRKDFDVDNSAQGGISCELDILTWKLKSLGTSEHPVADYTEHPDSNVPFNKNLDFKNETIALIQKVGLLFPSCRVIGWDIVLTPDGPHILEINPGFGIDHIQISCKQGLAEQLLEIDRSGKKEFL